MFLENAVKFNADVQPVCLATSDVNPGTAVVTGWGWTNEDFNLGEKPNALQTAEVPIWENGECQRSYKGLMKANKISANQMCAGGRDGGLDCEIAFEPFLIFPKIFSTLQLVGQTAAGL